MNKQQKFSQESSEEIRKLVMQDVTIRSAYHKYLNTDMSYTEMLEMLVSTLVEIKDKQQEDLEELLMLTTRPIQKR